MEKPLANHVTGTQLMLTDGGQLYVYISDVLADGCDSASTTAVAWACDTVNEEGVREHNLALTFDMPSSVDGILDSYNVDRDGEEVMIPIEDKPKFDALRAQLQEAINRLDRVHYEY